VKFKGAEWIKPNRNEAARVVGFDLVNDADFVKAAGIFVARTGCKVVAITRSSKGMSIFERSGKGSRARLRRLDSPTHALEVYDVTGGGDTAIAVMALMAAVRAPLEDTIELANLASGVTVLHVGTYAPTPHEVLELFAQHTVSKESSKLVDGGQAQALMKQYRAAGKKVAFTNGCFDIFHAGHVQTLQFARSQGDVLIVGINSDASVRRQGKAPDRPLVEEFARAMVLSSLACVDHVIIYDEDTPIPLLKKLKPHVLVKGGDYGKKQVVGWQLVEGYGGKVVVAPLVDGLSTTRLVAKIRGGGAS
ncbi:MAG TPA: D-glycero-beta-D-manno-heptose 1-phosphate adenylyltransferase, partial [Planctomycetota bacterium]|nr:D-glycero-beta-D-manno-heptose 1-phosphate adenylyltransferase [Planctomycetota bacterium]